MTSAPTVSRIVEIKVALFLQGLFRPLEIGDIECHAMDEPGLAIFAAHHLGFAVKPDHVPVPRDDAIRRIAAACRSGTSRRLPCSSACLSSGWICWYQRTGIFQPFRLR